VALGGWIVVFMTRVRHASSLAGSATATGFWGGMTAGRLLLPFLTVRIGEFWSIIIYLAVCVGLELIFWLVPSLVVSAVASALIGAFLGKPPPIP
jgi:fucose permease